MKALLKIAAKVQSGGKNVTGLDVAAAVAEGATDIEDGDKINVVQSGN